jgi:uncharacterized short protein YbdD (DUF466 family)
MKTGTDRGAKFGSMASMEARNWNRVFLASWQRAVQFGRVIIGVPDYETYLCHQREHHPERIPMSYEQFFLDRQTARYKGGGGRCC